MIGLSIKLEEQKVPKIKTNRAAAKRFRVTGSGKIKRNKGYKRHILSSKGKKRKRQLAQGDDGGGGGVAQYSSADTL